MARLYSDEQFPREVSEKLRTLGHNVLTVQDAGNANLGISDQAVLAFATATDRAVLTLNRYDFARLHRSAVQQNVSEPCHAGIIVCTNDLDRNRLVQQIHQAICTEEPLAGKLIRIVRPSTN